MTIFRATTEDFGHWGNEIEKEIDLAQMLAADPHRNRTFRLIAQSEFIELTGASPWQWKTFTKDLRDKGDLPPFSGHVKVTLAQVHQYMDQMGLRPSRPDGVPRGIRIAVANFKGGAAKSTTTLHLGTRLAMKGYRVLVIDLDGQGTLSRLLAVQPYRIRAEQTFAAAIGMKDDDGDIDVGPPLPLSPLPTFIDGLDLIPAGMAVAAMDMELMTRIQEGTAGQINDLLRRALEGVDKDYDFVLLDFQPSFSLSQLLLLRLADSILMPVPTETPDLAGTGDFLRLTSRWITELNRLYGYKEFDPVMVLHVRTKTRMTANESSLSAKEREELENQLVINNAVIGMAGRVFGVHRPLVLVEDRPAISVCLANLKSVYEADHNDYDMRALRFARQQYDQLIDRVLEAVRLRWDEVVAKGGSYE